MTDMVSKHDKIARVFPRRTAATPEDPFAFTGPPPCGELPGISEIHISVAFTYDMQKAEQLADMWSATGLPVRMGGPAFCEPGGAFVPGRYLKYGYVITSRGCPNRCWFCAVPKREGGVLRELPITSGWNVLDDNLLACSCSSRSARPLPGGWKPAYCVPGMSNCSRCPGPSVCFLPMTRRMTMSR